MKILVIEDHEGHMQDLIDTLSQKHETLAILVRSQSLQSIVNEVEVYSPDIILLDHDLGKDFNGKSLAAVLSIPKEKLFGISSGIGQEYCSKIFQGKSGLSPAPDELDNPVRVQRAKKTREKLLELIEKPVN